MVILKLLISVGLLAFVVYIVCLIVALGKVYDRINWRYILNQLPKNYIHRVGEGLVVTITLTTLFTIIYLLLR